MDDGQARMRLGERTFDFDREVAVMAIVNRTPDSFYDRGRTYALGAAIEHALMHVEAGADIIDVGGVRAGPGEEVPPDVERERVVPFIEAFRAQSNVPLSVDTYRHEVAAAALDAGADLVNDVSGLVEPELADAVARFPHAGLVAMHAGGPPRTRPLRPTYEPDCTAVVVETCRRVADEARRRGVPPERIVVDPGHDFGKNTFHSLEITRRLPELVALGYPVLVALSRKDFIGEVLADVTRSNPGTGKGPEDPEPGTSSAVLPPEERLEGSLACAVLAVALGARIVRVHDTRATVRAVRMAEAALGLRTPAAALRGLD